MAIDKQSKKMYVSLRATNEVGVVDIATRKLSPDGPFRERLPRIIGSR